MGMWDDMVGANETALGLVNAVLAERHQPPTACGHYPEWLEYGYLEQGRARDAKKQLAACYDYMKAANNRSVQLIVDRHAAAVFVRYRGLER